MRKGFNQVYQFKVALQGIKPSIWRRIQVPETYSFWDLHVAIQDAMGWEDYHLHEFSMIDPETGIQLRIGIPDVGDAFRDEVILPGWKMKVADLFSMEDKVVFYVYDFGDSWVHRVRLEKILPRDTSVTYPICIAGKRACPPEDCGGVWGYEYLLEIIKNPQHKEYRHMLNWLGGKFDSEHFDMKDIRFDDPEKRRKTAFG